MKLYEIELSAKVTVDICKAFPVFASSKEEAIEKAISELRNCINNEFSMVYEIQDIEVGYTGILKNGI
ncbi:MAG: hypothetical protein UH678_07925 [Fibrobacteraceae bacterium]|nr:hypothetical protein [Fibrobacteraceae bacterium]